jgi:hypothetical protein
VRVPGPLVIEQPDTTTVVLPDQAATLDAVGNIVLELGA